MRNLKRKTRKHYRKPMSEEQRDQLISAILNAKGNPSIERMIIHASNISHNTATK